jgi:4-diphosphocytidyl-2-C-methyl-D-erythritol kinase
MAFPAKRPPRELRLLARAKINLYLHVLGRRDDGYHLLDSLVAFAGVGDDLVCREAADITLRMTGPFAASLLGEGDNLVLRAARRLRLVSGKPKLGAALTLTKRLPVASGIGGGSADAAATLLALDRLWNLDLGAARLADIGLDLGADVPVCLAGVPSFMAGVGEALAPAPALPPAHVVLINPGLALPTASVFRRFAGAFSPAGRWSEAPADAATLAQWLATRANDLTDAALGIVPAIGTVLSALKASQGCLLARMSGSGATCFGLYADAAAATAAAATLSRPSWWVVAAPLLDQLADQAEPLIVAT